MISTKILPKFFKDVLQHIPTLALKSVNWKEVIKSMGPMLLRMGSAPLADRERDSIKNLETKGLRLVNALGQNRAKWQLTDQELLERGQKLLVLYFSQLKNPQGLNLDLRYKHFDTTVSSLDWAPNNVWYQFSENFRLSLIDIYKGFYFKDEKQFESGLNQIGLSKSLSSEKTIELKKLFYTHFGPGEQELVKFQIEKFSESFYELFHFFIENEVELDKDFIFLGIYLVTLYMHLEELELEFNVREAFFEVFKA